MKKEWKYEPIMLDSGGSIWIRRGLILGDNGGGMDPKPMRRCLSFGFSERSQSLQLGSRFRWKWLQNQYYEAWSRCHSFQLLFDRHDIDPKYWSSIIYILTQSGYDRIVVPMIHYEFNFLTGCFDPLQTSNENLSVILKWSPFSTEEELLKQFEDVGSHGTKVIIYNLWLDEDGTMELDIESDPEDICIAWDGKGKVKEGSRMTENEQHIANRLKYSLRVISLLKSIYILS
ncbi:hypothetical protein LXL04_017795 [Taraxacum kok-saghyz]